MEKEEEKKERKPRQAGKRSPGYPMISLEEAVQKAMTLWEKDRNNLIPIEAAYEHLGYKSKAGYAARVIAALKKFELIFEKQSTIKLTDEAVDLMLHSSSDENYIKIIKNLALKPNIYERILNDNNGILPSDNTLKVQLIKNYGFNPKSVDDFIINFRKTIEFAGLSGVNKESEEKKKMIISKDSGRGVDSSKLVIEIPIPLSETELASIKMPYPLTDAQWNKIESILKAYKPTSEKSDVQAKDETQKS